MWGTFLKAIAQQLTRIADGVDALVTAANSIAASAQAIAKALPTKPTVGTEVKLALEVQGENTMTGKAKATAGPTLIIDTANMRLYAIGLDALGAKGAPLAAGASIAPPTLSPTGVMTLTPDNTPLPDPSGTPSDYSAAIAPVNPPQTGVPVTITVQVTNADGTTQAPATAQVQFTPGTEASLELEEL
jgi:hypothetical protein